MMRYISPADQKLAQKYSLGTPIRKYRLGVARSSPSSSFFSGIQALCAMALGMIAVAGGIYVDVSTTISSGAGWMWLYLLPVAATPIVSGFVLRALGHRRLALFNVLAAFLSFFLVTVYNGVFRVPLAGRESDPFTSLLSGLFIFLVGLGLFWIGFHRLSAPHSILICTDGCLVMHRWQRTCMLRWEDITSIWYSKASARIVCSDGTRLTIHYQWPNGTVVRDVIYRKTLRYLRSRALAAYEAGEQVQFGKYSLSQQGISSGGQIFSWEHIRECEYMEEAVALIGNDDTCLDQASLRVLPNAAVFVSLVNSIKKLP